MQAAILSPHQITLVSRPAPTPGRGELVLRVALVGLCGSDQARYWGAEKDDLPSVVFGHEFSGRVYAIGQDVTKYQVGDAVTVAPLITCGVCRHCQSGHEHLCPQRVAFGVAVDGAAQEFVAAPAHRTYRLAPDVSLLEGALVEPLAVAVHAVGQVNVQRDDTALVMGAGAIGLLVAQILKAKGLARIAIVDIDARRLKLAHSLGIEAMVSDVQVLKEWRDRTAPEGIPVVIESSGAPAALAMLPHLLAPLGRVVIVSKFPGPVPLQLLDWLRREATIRFSRYFTAKDFEIALALVARKQVAVRPLVGAVVPASQLGTESGRVVMEQAKATVRLVLDWGSES